MNVKVIPVWIAEYGVAPLIFFILIISFMFLGSLLGRFRIKNNRNGDRLVVNDSFISAIYGLTALLIAFSFSTAVNHFDKRQDTVLQEVTTISNTYDTAALLGPADQLRFQNLIRNYLDDRINFYSNFQNAGALDVRVIGLKENLKKIKSEAFDMVLNAPQGTNTLANNTFLLNIEKMSEGLGKEILMLKIHPPPLIMRSLALLIAIVAFLSGYSMVIKKEKDWVLGFIFALVMMGAIFVIMNMEYPHAGLLKLEDMGSELVILRQSM